MSIYFAKNFRFSEIICPCGCGKIKPIGPTLIYLLQSLRDKIGKPIYISKGGGIRCKSYNKRIGGYRSSPHIKGMAVDIWVKDFDYKKLAELAEKVKFKRIGLYPFSHSKFIHVDVQPPKPNAAWIRWKNGKYVYYGTLKTAFKTLLDYEKGVKFEIISYP